jgi:hypothetical protein
MKAFFARLQEPSTHAALAGLSAVAAQVAVANGADPHVVGAVGTGQHLWPAGCVPWRRQGRMMDSAVIVNIGSMLLAAAATYGAIRADLRNMKERITLLETIVLKPLTKGA